MWFGVGYVCLALVRGPARWLHSGKIVLWLRGFHGEPVKGVNFPVILGAACSGQAIPVTLQDDTYSHCPTVGLFRARFPKLAALPLLAVIIFLAIFARSLLENPATGTINVIAFMCIMIMDIMLSFALLK
jgi:hypothetical protein